MVYASFDGREIVKALRSMGYRPAGREGSHVKLRYESSDTDEVRIVSVPMTDSDQISQDTYRSIAEQCGADDFDAWCGWIEALL
ncbi:type II toxin-antitoxin system HicA family toxin [Halorubrum sp. CSM-61]|uniref:type II toxin-antitoxin system HicA family toxin n=1 Tax=Halorubrum sp. CSM-61 TaxID=2485838 RepID=UPI000F4B1469|nr:type II toxin-antitoxin system HicA family toxin [Halorubrum sp. CSM-61]